MTELERWVSSKEIAQYIGINKDTLQRWITDEENSLPPSGSTLEV